MNDAHLLQSFVDGSETAFRELVQRHLSLVLGTARRMTGDNALAEDIAQTVFIVLARKASTLRQETILSGWLYRTTCFVAKRALCSEMRRQRREQEALAMQDQERDGQSNWETITPELDHALSSLGNEDRNAILLRFFQDQPLRDVGIALGISEEAAKKRVSRALLKLRGALVRRGKEVTVGALMAGLSREAALSASPQLAAQVSRAAVAGAVAGAAGVVLSPLAAGVLAAMHWAKVRMITAAAAVVIAAAILIPTVFWPETPAVVKQPKNLDSSRLAEIKRSRENGQREASPTATDPTLSVDDWRTLRVTVIEDQTSKPLPGVEVTHSMMPVKNGKRTPAPFHTDESGSVDLRIPSSFPHFPEMNQFQVWLEADGFAQRQIHWLCTTGHVLNHISSNYTVRLSRGITVGGIVVNEEGHPMAGVQVQGTGSNYRGFTIETSNGKVTSPPEIRAEDFSSYSTGSVLTDAAGRFQFAHYPQDLPRFLVELTSPEGVNIRYRTPQGKSLAAEQLAEFSFADFKNEAARFVVPRGVTISGVVVDAEGKPVPEATVIEATQWGNLKPHSTNRTDTAGRFELRNRQVREFILAASAEGHAGASITVSAQPGMDPVRIQLPKQLPLRGKVVNAQGEPQSGISIKALDISNTGMGLSWSGETDSEGRFTWLEAPAVPVVFSVASLSGQFAVRLQASEEEHLVTLSEGNAKARISGRVLDAETRAPVEEFSVKVLPAVPGYNPNETEKVVTGHDGTFEAEIASSEFGPRPLHGVLLQVQAEGYEPLVTAEYPLKEQEITLELSAGGAFEGTIVDRSGKPAAQAKLALTAIAKGAFASDPGDLRPHDGAAQDADKNGRFKVSKEPGATFLVVSHDRGWAAVDLKAQQTNQFDVVLRPWGQIEGTVLLGGAPQAGVKINLRQTIYDIMEPFLVFRSATSDNEGRFIFEQLPAGNYHLYTQPTHVRRPDDTYIESLQTPVSLDAGETETVTFGSSGVSVVGRLHLPPGVHASWSNTVVLLSRDVPIPQQPDRARFVKEENHRAARIAFAGSPAVLAQFGEMRSYAGQVSDDGTVTIEHVPPGRYILEASAYAPKKLGERISGNREFILARTRVMVSVPEGSGEDTDPMVVSFDDVTLEPF